MTRQAGDMKTIGKHMRLPKWVVDVIEERGLREKRTFSVQLCFELEQLAHFRSVKPKVHSASAVLKVDLRVKPAKRRRPKRSAPVQDAPAQKEQ